MLHRDVRRHVLAFLVVLPSAPLFAACVLPQFDPAHRTAPASVDELIEANHYRAALALLEKKLPELESGRALRHDLSMARIELGFDHLEAALDLIDRSLAAHPESAELHVEAAAAAGRLAERASLFKQISLAKRVRRELDAALVLDPSNADAIYGLVLFENLAPPMLGGDRAEARKLAEELTVLDPPRGDLAQAKLAAGQHDAAAQEGFLKQAVAATPPNYDARIGYAEFARDAVPPRLDLAEDMACQALALDPARAEAWQTLAQVSASRGNRKAVEELLAAEQRFNPDDLSPAYFAAVGFLAGDTHLDYAQTLLERYLAQPLEGAAPSLAKAHYRLALVQERRGQLKQALESIAAALREDPDFNLAKQAAKRLGRPE